MSNPGDPNRDRELLDSAIPIDFDELEKDGPAGPDGSDKPAPAADPGAVDLSPIDISDPELDPDPMSGSKIHMLGRKDGLDQERWTRTPNADGTGATHCKTFVSKLRLEAIAHMDNNVNEWLEQHPEVEVKFTTSSIGKLVGKVSEDALFLTVWV